MNNMSKYAHMNFEELLEKYQTLLAENKNLKKELKNLKERFGISDIQTVPEQNTDVLSSDSSYLVEESLPPNRSCENEDRVSLSSINNFSDPQAKIELFMALFKGRDDVFAKRWENKKERYLRVFAGLLKRMESRIVQKTSGKLRTLSE
ncbi:hypothetical protein SPACI_050450 [Sporomusa acidovorans DSM 3132]|uniref:TOTE conflict system primase domain-containing protein n=2 Tax=Sporomusa TaxID=2375 RepID=A0ABZ3J940_SPOA4|nr:hypothetical protein SPACI_38540 [Sporomusa acidovorans DSM 3132]SDF67125.1 hypothetical protein SAMN04488499_10673 [Sporomusa acidovorans]